MLKNTRVLIHMLLISSGPRPAFPRDGTPLAAQCMGSWKAQA